MRILVVLFLLWGISGCGVYSFTGVSTTAKTISIAGFLNRATAGPPNIGINFTEKLRDYYQRNTSLSIINKEADLVVTGNIIRYEALPVATTSNDRSAQTRLTIAVEVDFVNNVEDKKNFTQTFSFYQDFPQDQTLSQAEAEKVDAILEQIVIDIFNKTVADW